MRRLAALCLVLVILFAWAAPAMAHAVLLRSNPGANAALASAPAQIELWMSEPVEPAFSEIMVLDATGARVDDGQTRLDPAEPTLVRVGLRSLPDGVYTVSWRVLSTVDGHVTAGAFPFAVGNVDPAALAAAGAASQETGGGDPAEVIPRWLTLLGAAFVIGGYLFSAYIWLPAWQHTTETGPAAGLRLFLAIRRTGLGLFLAGSIGTLLWQAGNASGLSQLQVLFAPGLGDLLFGTRYGLLWLSRVAMALVLMQSGKRWEAWLEYARPLAVSGILLSLTLNAHAAAAPRPFLPLLSDWVHILAASLWLGGLVHFAAGLYATRRLEPGQRTRLAAALVPRFSNLGLASVGTLFLTGLYNSFVTVGTLDGLFNTPYGQGLFIKLWIIVPLIALAAINLLVLRPALRAAISKPQPHGGAVRSPLAHSSATPRGPRSTFLARRLSMTVAGEVLLGAAVLFAAASFATIPPARTLTSGLTLSQRAEDLRVTLSIAPGKVGVNQFDVGLVDGLGQAVAAAGQVGLRFTPLSGDLPPSEAILENQQNGHYTAQGSYLSLPGGWQTQVVVRRPGLFDAFANFDVQVAAAGQPSQASAQAAFARYTALLLYVIALLYVFALRGLARTRFTQWATGVVPALALALVGIAVFQGAETRGQSGAAGLVNPIPPSAASLEQGQALYQDYCLACHGPRGLGDGPAGLAMNPRPADLQVHMVPGAHTDGVIYDWITNGYPDSPMPAFREALTDEERWHVLNFIRTLTPGS